MNIIKELDDQIALLKGTYETLTKEMPLNRSTLGVKEAILDGIMYCEHGKRKQAELNERKAAYDKRRAERILAA